MLCNKTILVRARKEGKKGHSCSMRHCAVSSEIPDLCKEHPHRTKNAGQVCPRGIGYRRLSEKQFSFRVNYRPGPPRFPWECGDFRLCFGLVWSGFDVHSRKWWKPVAGVAHLAVAYSSAAVWGCLRSQTQFGPHRIWSLGHRVFRKWPRVS
jgi:hypothetical protein